MYRITAKVMFYFPPLTTKDVTYVWTGSEFVNENQGAGVGFITKEEAEIEFKKAYEEITKYDFYRKSESCSVELTEPDGKFHGRFAPWPPPDGNCKARSY